MEKYVVYASVFVVVVLTYMLLQTFLETPKKDEDKEWTLQNLPLFYRWTYWLLRCFTDSLGPILARMYSPETILSQTRLLKAANLKLSVEMFLTSQALFGTILFTTVSVIGVFLLQNWTVGVLAGILLGVLGWMSPFLMAQEKAKTRQQAIIRALPFAIDLIGSAMRSGQDFMAAVHFYVRNDEATNPLVQEFNQVLLDMQLGQTREQAMLSMDDRVQVDAFTAFVAAVVQGEKAGASIVNTLKNQGAALRRERFALARQKAEAAQTMIILPLGLLLLPAFLLVIGYPIGYDMAKTFSVF